MAKQVTIEEALDYCLANPEGMSREELLSKFTQYREELRPLLALGTEVQSVSPPPLPADRRAAMKSRLMTAAANQHTQAAPLRPAAGIAPSRKPAGNRLKELGTALLGRPLWPAAALAAVLVAFLWWGSARSLPGSPLYNIKLAGESFQVSFARTPSSEVRTHVSLANNRLYDLRTMQQGGKLAQAGDAFTNYGDHLKKSSSSWKQTTGTERVDLAKLLYASSLAGQQTFQSFDGTVGSLPPSVQSSIQDISNTLNGLNTDTLQALLLAGSEPAQAIKDAPGGLVLTPLVPTASSTVPSRATSVVAAAGSVTRGTISTPFIAVSSTPPTRVGASRTTGILPGTGVSRATAEALTTTAIVPSPRASHTPTNPTHTAIVPTHKAGSTVTAEREQPTHTAEKTHTARPTSRPSVTARTDPTGVPGLLTATAHATVLRIETRTRVPETPTVVPTRGGANTPTAVPTFSVCNLEVRAVDITCLPTGCASWSATVVNTGSAPGRAVWNAELQINQGEGFHTVDVQSGTVDVQQGGTALLTGSFCYPFPSNTNNIKLRFSIRGDASICAPQGNSEAKRPCSIPVSTIVPSVTPRPSNTPRVRETSSPEPRRTEEPTKTPKPKSDTPQPRPQPTSTRHAEPVETMEPTEEAGHQQTSTPRPSRTTDVLSFQMGDCASTQG